jgi:hypothetical protein
LIIKFSLAPYPWLLIFRPLRGFNPFSVQVVESYTFDKLNNETPVGRKIRRGGPGWRGSEWRRIISQVPIIIGIGYFLYHSLPRIYRGQKVTKE